jgi:DNA-binding response OmpR family regulator
VSTQPADLKPASGLAPERILVVEDEVLVRLVIAEYLRDCGYRVHEAASAEEAMVVLQSSDVSIDLVFSDVVMTGQTDGFALARWLREHKPDVKVILTAGIDRSAEVAATLCEAGPMLEKPYEPGHVVERIRQLVSKARA